MKNLFFYRLGNNTYWGRLHSYPYALTFRRRPVQRDRWYISGGYSFRLFIIPASQFNVGGLMAEVRTPSGNHVHFGIDPNRCYGVGDLGQVYEPHAQQTPAQRDNFRNEFRNRMLEFGDSHFVPLMKKLKFENQRNTYQNYGKAA